MVKKILVLFVLMTSFLFSFGLSEENEWPPLMVQGNLVSENNYEVTEDGEYLVNLKVLSDNGFDVPDFLVVDGRVNINDYADYVRQDLKQEIANGLNGDNQFILFNPNPYEGKNMSDGYGINLMRHFSSGHFDGKHVGSNDNKDLATMIYAEAHLLGADVGLFPYKLEVAEVPSTTLSIDGKELVLMDDYMPLGSTADGSYKGNREVIYVGVGNDLNGLDLDGKAVVFDGSAGGGIRDRYNVMLEMGAKEIFVIETDDDSQLGYWEHPMLAESFGYKQFITLDALEEFFGFKNNYMIQETSVFLEYDFVKLVEEKTAYNVVATIAGDVEEEIVIISNYAGWGSINGLEYQTVSYDTVGPVTMLRLIDYYSENKPHYTMTFAFTADKWTGQVGMDDLLKDFEDRRIKTFIDIYGLGGSGKYEEPFTLKNVHSKANFIGSSTTDLGNSLTNKITRAGYESIMVRGRGVAKVFEPNIDTFENTNIDKFNLERDYIKHLVDQLEGKYNKDDELDYAEVGKVVLLEDKKFVNVETKHFNVFYNPDLDLDLNLLNYVDEVYRNISMLNHYSSFDDKIEFYIDTSNEFVVKNGFIRDIGEIGTGAYADYDLNAMYSSVLHLGNVSHEVNHIVNKVHYRNVQVEGSTLDESHGKHFDSAVIPGLLIVKNHNHSSFLLPYWDNPRECGTIHIIENDIEFDLRTSMGFTLDGVFYKQDMIEGTFLDYIRAINGYNAMRRFTQQGVLYELFERYALLMKDTFNMDFEITWSHFLSWYEAEGELDFDSSEDDNFTEYDYVLFETYLNMYNTQNKFRVNSEKITNTSVSEDLTDMSLNHIYYDAVNFFYQRGIIKGFPDQTMRPDANITRAEIAKIVSIGCGFKAIEGLSPSYSDTSNHWAKDYVELASQNEVFGGYSDGSFRPDKLISNVEVITVISNLSGGPSENLEKESQLNQDNKWYTVHVADLIEKGILTKLESDAVMKNPYLLTTRSYFMELMYRANLSNYIDITSN